MYLLEDIDNCMRRQKIYFSKDFIAGLVFITLEFRFLFDRKVTLRKSMPMSTRFDSLAYECCLSIWRTEKISLKANSVI